jgi:hypothetical protein
LYESGTNRPVEADCAFGADIEILHQLTTDALKPFSCPEMRQLDRNARIE